MKVTVTFNTVKIVVPCGDGEITVRELTQLATTRYKKATGKPRLSWVSVHSLKAKEGGILDPDDRLVDVCDDREQLIAFYDEEGIPQGGDGMSASSDESETTGGSSGYNRNTDIEVSGEFGTCALQVRRGSEPALNKLEGQGGGKGGAGQHYGGEETKRWSAAVMNRDIKSSKNDLSVIDEASFYGDANFDPGGGRFSPLPPPFERGQGSGAARDSDRPTPFSRDSNRLSMQIGHEEGRWLEAAEKASSDQNYDFQPPPPSSRAIEADFGPQDRGGELGRQSSQQVRREPLGGSSPPHQSLEMDKYTRFVIHNEIGPLGIHVVPSGDPAAAGLLIQGIEPGGRIDRDGRLAVTDRIVEINGYSLTDIPFHKAQEIFKEALFAKELLLVVDREEEGFRQEQLVTEFRHLEDNKENINIEMENTGTLGRKLGTGPGSKLTSTVQAANTRKIGKKLYVSLVKGVHGLGFSITTRDIQAGGVAPIYIKNILPKGAAIENGQLRPGDRLLEVNQESMDGKSQSEVVAILRNTPQQGEVNLVVSRQELVEEIEANTLELRGKDRTGRATPSSHQPSTTESTAPNTEESEEYNSISPDVSVNSNGEVIFPWKHREILTLDIPVHDTERAGLGVSVKGKTTGGGAKGIVDLGIFVKSVIHGGAASKDGRLKTNDQLVNINGISLLGKANCDAMDTLRRAMHEEGPTPGVITLTVARRLVVGSQDVAARLRATGRDSVTSMLTSSSGDESYREYRVSANNTTSSIDTSHNETVIYVEKPVNKPVFDNFLPPAPRNPVVDRLMGKGKERLPDPGLRNDSYYRATGHDTFNATMLQRLDSPDGIKQLQSPTVHQVGGETIMIEQYGESGRKPGRPHSPDGCERLADQTKSDSDATPTDAAYASQTSLEEQIAGFARDQPGRQSMSEKRHATLDAKSTDTYQRSKRARQEREQAALEQGEVGPMLGMKKSSSLESLQTMMSEMKMDTVRAPPTRSKGSRVVRGRGCNESFRAAVDRSYEASQDSEDQPGGWQEGGEEMGDGQLSVADQEVMETFDRADYRQSGSSLDSNNEFKKKKNGKLFKGFGMFKFGKQRAKSSDSGRLSQLQDRKTPTAELNYARQTPTGEVREGTEREGGWRDEEARAKLVAEQARIQQHYRRLVQQRQDSEQERGELVEEVYQGVEHRQGGGEALPASLAAARPGSRSGITGTPSDPRFANYEEIQRHLSRRQAQYHSQRREHPARSDRPVSNFYEYESVQSNISHGRQLSQSSSGSGGGQSGHPGSGGGQSGHPGSQTHHQSGLPVYCGAPDTRTQNRLDLSPARPEMPPPRLQPPPPHYRSDGPPPYVRQGRPEGAHGMPVVGSLSVAPLPTKYGQFSGRGGQADYEDHRVAQMGGSMGDYDDPYGRIMFRGGGPAGRRPSHPGAVGGGSGPGPHKAHHMQHSMSQSRIQSHQVPKNQQLYIPSSLPPGSKV